jgi:hypothetical protein
MLRFAQVQLWLVAFLIAGSVWSFAGEMRSPEQVYGRVLDRSSQPIPGLTVRIYSVKYKAEPAITDVSGFFRAVLDPFDSGPYWVDVYWGKSLLYHEFLGASMPHPSPYGFVPTVELQPIVLLGREK